MKTLHFSLLFCLSLLLSCSGNNNDVVITGNLTGVEDGTVIELLILDGNLLAPFQKDTLTNGVFRFEFADSTDVAKSYIVMGRGEGFPPTWLDVWVEPGARVKIKGDGKLLRTWDVQSNVSEQKEANKYMAKNRDLENRAQIVMRDAYALWDEIDKQPEKRDELRAQINILYAENDSLGLLMVENNLEIMEADPKPGTIWMEKLYLHSRTARYTPDFPMKDRLIALYNGLSETVKNTPRGQDIDVSLFPPTVVKVGEAMADADMYDVDGNLRHLADYKGKYILLDFWSRGCGPCIAAIPEMKEIAEKYKDRLVIVSISSDTKDLWIEASQKEGITWANFNDFKGNNGLFARYGVVGIPNYFLIAPDGIVNSSWMGYGTGSLLAKMEELIGAN